MSKYDKYLQFAYGGFWGIVGGLAFAGVVFLTFLIMGYTIEEPQPKEELKPGESKMLSGIEVINVEVEEIATTTINRMEAYNFIHIRELKQAFNNHLQEPPNKLTYEHKDGYTVEWVSDVYSEDFGKYCHCGWGGVDVYCTGREACFTKQEIEDNLEAKFK